jgi:HK97 family phage major capsid protein
MSMINKLTGEIVVLETERNGMLDELNTLAAPPAEGVEARSAEAITTRSDEIAARGAEIQTEIDAKRSRIVELEALEAERAKPTAPNFIRTPETAQIDDVRSMDSAQMIDMLKRHVDDSGIDNTSMVPILQRHKADRDWLRNLAARSTEAYTRAFGKIMTGREMFLSEEERAAMAVGTSTQGGLLVPTHLDPTMIITNDGVSNVIRPLSRVVTLARENTWNGVTTVGSTSSWDAELAEVSDDSPAIGAESIDTHVAACFVQASYQAFEDIENLAADVAMILQDSKERLEAVAHATGSGTAQPRGIFTALDAAAGSEIESAGAAAITLADLQGLKRGVPVRNRANGTFLMNPIWADAVKPLDTNVYLNVGNSDQLLSKPLVESDEAPAVISTDALDNEVIYGDFRNFVIVDKPGSSTLEFIPNMTGTAANLPNGKRGWYMRFRSGSDSINDNAFRMLQDKTSA